MRGAEQCQVLRQLHDCRLQAWPVAFRAVGQRMRAGVQPLRVCKQHAWFDSLCTPRSSCC